MGKTKRKIQLLILEAAMLLLSLIIIIPLLVMLLGSLKTPAEAAMFNIDLPSKWVFSNYAFCVYRRRNREGG